MAVNEVPPRPSADAIALYRLLDAEDRILYIGVTNNLSVRWAAHAREKSWWPRVARRQAIWYETRREAHAAEVTAIEAHRPLYNAAHGAPSAKTLWRTPTEKEEWLRHTQTWRRRRSRSQRLLDLEGGP